MALEKVEGLLTTLPATKGRSGTRTFYNFLISPYELLRVVYISHLAKGSNDDLETYQRMVKPARLQEIGKFVDEGGKFPTNIVINFKTGSTLRFDQKEVFGDTATGTLHLPPLYGVAWVIDGQHRLYGYAHAEHQERDRSVVSVLAYENLPIREEIKMFVDINTQQVKVSRNIVNELLANLNINAADLEDRLDAIHPRIAMRLNDYPTSPIRGRVISVSDDKTNTVCITNTSLADGISHNTLVGSIYRQSRKQPAQLRPGLLSHVSGEAKNTVEKAVVTLSQYFSLFSTELEEHWRLGDAKGGYLCTNNGLRALIQLMSKLLKFVGARDDLDFLIMEPDEIVDRIQPFVAPVIEFFKQADANQILNYRRGSSLQSVDQNCFGMMTIINESIPHFMTPELLKHLSTRDVDGTKKAKLLIDEISAIVYKDVTERLKRHYGADEKEWWMQAIPRTIKIECDKAFYAAGSGERWHHLTFSNYPAILVFNQNWDLFKNNYNFYGKVKRATQIRWMSLIDKSRAVTNHAERGPLSKQAVEYVKQVHQLVKTHIEQGVEVNPATAYIFEPDVAATEDAAA